MQRYHVSHVHTPYVGTQITLHALQYDALGYCETHRLSLCRLEGDNVWWVVDPSHPVHPTCTEYGNVDIDGWLVDPDL